MRLLEHAKEANQRIVPCDLNWTRLDNLRFALAQFFDHPASHHRLLKISKVRIDFHPDSDVLSRRLAAMVEAGLLTRSPYDAGNRTREEYLLTGAGTDLFPVLHALAQWGAAPPRRGRPPARRRPRGLRRGHRERRHLHGVRRAAARRDGLLAAPT